MKELENFVQIVSENYTKKVSNEHIGWGVYCTPTSSSTNYYFRKKKTTNNEIESSFPVVWFMWILETWFK